MAAYSYDLQSFITVKYGADGALVWLDSYPGLDFGGLHGTAIALDGGGNVYVLGNATVDRSPSDYLVIKYSPSGSRLWTAQYDGGLEDCAKSMVVDQAGNVYVAGSSTRSRTDGSTATDVVTVRFDFNGSLSWTGRHEDAEAVAIGLDSQGNIHVAAGGNIAGMPMTVTIKYRSDGHESAIGSYGWMIPRAMAIDAAGNAYVAGEGQQDNPGWSIVRFDSDGTSEWFAGYPTSGQAVYPNAIAVDPAGGVVVSGTAVLPPARPGTLVVKFDAFGNKFWEAGYNQSSLSHDKPYSMILDRKGSIYVTGESAEPPEWHSSYLTLKYSPPAAPDPDGDNIENAVDTQAGDRSSHFTDGPMAGDGRNSATTGGNTFGHISPDNPYEVKVEDLPGADGMIFTAMRADVKVVMDCFEGFVIQMQTQDDAGQFTCGPLLGQADGSNSGIVVMKPNPTAPTVQPIVSVNLYPGKSARIQRTQEGWDIQSSTGAEVPMFTNSGTLAATTIQAADSDLTFTLFSPQFAVIHVLLGRATVEGADGVRISASAGQDVYINLAAQSAVMPREELQNLILLIPKLDLPQGLGNSLTAKLQNAVKALDKQNSKTAVNEIEGFIKEVQAQLGKRITTTQADMLIAAANHILNGIRNY